MGSAWGKEDGRGSGASAEGGGVAANKDDGLFGAWWNFEACCMPARQFPGAKPGALGKEAAEPPQKVDTTPSPYIRLPVCSCVSPSD